MDNLVKLINALSPTEKQHFKKNNNPNVDFVLLFDFINRKKSCITSEVLSFLSKKQKNKKSFNSSYLSVVKNYLKNKILESLRVQYIHKKKNYELLSRSMNVEILLDKGLYSLAEIEISNDKNLDISFPIERLLLLRRKAELDFTYNYNNTSLEGIETLYDSRIKTGEQLVLLMKIGRIISILNYQYYHNLNDTSLITSLMNEPYMQDESLATDIATRFQFHWAHAQYHDLMGNSVGAIKHFNKSMQIWLDNPKYIDTHTRLYLNSCFTYFKYIIHQDDPFLGVLPIINFEDLKSKIKIENLSGDLEEKYVFIFHLFEIISLRKQNNFDQIKKLVKPWIENEIGHKITSIYNSIIYTYYSALAYYDAEDLDMAEKILFTLLNPLDERLADSSTYCPIYLLLNIIILLEKGNEKKLSQLLPKYKSFLKQQGYLKDFEMHFIKMSSQLISSRFKSTPELVYQRFLKRLCEAQVTDNSGIKIEYDFFISWVKKKEEEVW